MYGKDLMIEINHILNREVTIDQEKLKQILSQSN
jgi:hypothetical protein